MKPEPPYDHTGEIFQINASLCWATALVFTAYYVWPSNLRWYAFYGFSVILCLAALGLVFNSLRLMRKIGKERAAWIRILKLGNTPTNAKLMSKHDMQDEGMN